MPKKAIAGVEPRRHPLNVRTTREIREKIIAAAEQSGRSLVQELEYRIENSFGRDAVFELLLGGHRNSRLLEKIAFAVRDARSDWADNADGAAKLSRKLDDIVKDEAASRASEKAKAKKH